MAEEFQIDMTVSGAAEAETQVKKVASAVAGADEANAKLATSAKASADKIKEQATVAETTAKKITELGTKHEEATKKTHDVGRATLEASRAFEDMQYGVAGVLNNIPGLIQSLGGGAGLAGVVSLLAVGITQLVKHLDLGGPALDALGEAAGRTAVKAGEAAMEADKHRVALDSAKESAEAITVAISKEDQALQDELNALKNNAEATANLDKQKKELLQSERDLALAKNAASDDDEITKLKKKHEINNDYSAASRKQEEDTLKNVMAKAEAEAKLHEKARQLELQRANEALKAKKNLEANESRKVFAEGEVGRGKNQLGGLLEQLGSLTNMNDLGLARYGEKMLTGITEKGDPLTQANILKANFERLKEGKKSGVFTYDQAVAHEQVTQSVNGADGQRRLAQIEAIIQQLKSGAAEAKASDEAKPQLDANAKAYGAPETYQKKSEAEATAVATARNKAAEAQVRLAHDMKLNQIKAETETFKHEAEVTKAEQEAEKKREFEAKKAEQEAAKKEREAKAAEVKEKREEAKRQSDARAISKELISMVGEPNDTIEIDSKGRQKKTASKGLPGLNANFIQQAESAANSVIRGGGDDAIARLMSIVNTLLTSAQKQDQFRQKFQTQLADMQRRSNAMRGNDSAGE